MGNPGVCLWMISNRWFIDSHLVLQEIWSSGPRSISPLWLTLQVTYKPKLALTNSKNLWQKDWHFNLHLMKKISSQHLLSEIPIAFLYEHLFCFIFHMISDSSEKEFISLFSKCFFYIFVSSWRMTAVEFFFAIQEAKQKFCRLE